MEIARPKSLAVVPLSRLSSGSNDPAAQPPCEFKAQANVVASTIEWMTRHPAAPCRVPSKGFAMLKGAYVSQQTAPYRITLLRVTHVHSLKRTARTIPRRLHAYGAHGASALCAADDWDEIVPPEEVTCPACLKIMNKQTGNQAV